MNTICSSSIEFDANDLLLLLITWYSIVDWLTCCTWKRLCSENLGRFFPAHDMILDDRSNSHQSCRAIKRPASGLDKSISHSHCCRSFVTHPSIFLSRLPWNLNPLLKSSSNQWKLWEGMQKKEISLGCKNICLLRFASQTWWLAMKSFFFLPWFPQLSWAWRIHDFLHALPRNTSQVCVLLAPQGFNIFLKIAHFHIISICFSKFSVPPNQPFSSFQLACVWALIFRVFEQWYLAPLSIDILHWYLCIWAPTFCRIVQLRWFMASCACTSLSPTHHRGGAVALLTIHLCICLCCPCLSFALYVRIIKNCVRSLFTWTDTYVL